MNFIRVRKDKAVNPAHICRAVWAGNEPGDGVLVLVVMEPDDMGQSGEYRVTGAMADLAWAQLTTSPADMVVTAVQAVMPALSAIAGSFAVMAENTGATVLLHEDLLQVARQLKEINLSLADVVANR